MRHECEQDNKCPKQGQGAGNLIQEDPGKRRPSDGLQRQNQADLGCGNIARRYRYEHKGHGYHAGHQGHGQDALHR